MFDNYRHPVTVITFSHTKALAAEPLLSVWLSACLYLCEDEGPLPQIRQKGHNHLKGATGSSRFNYFSSQGTTVVSINL